MSNESLKAYHAAELFHLPARIFNEKLVSSLEEKGVKVFSPQRDGFEFTHLVSVLGKTLSEEDLDYAMQTIIYAYDILSITRADVVVARFDEPPDPGVDTEVLIANSLGVPVVAYRTDVRTPYGGPSDKYGGMHSFPVKNSRVIILQESSLSPSDDLDILTEKIFQEIREVHKQEERVTPAFLYETAEIAKVLFEGIGDIHSEKGLEELANRCVENRELLKNFGPRAIGI